MNYQALTLKSSEPSDISLIDKGTQTSTVSVIDLMSSEQTPSKPPGKTINKSCRDANDIKVFEFCELIKDPEDDTVSIVKETFTEEVLTSSEGSFFEKPTHNRYIYCREVIQPYCKTFSKACPKYPTKNDKIFRTPSKISQKKSEHSNRSRPGSNKSIDNICNENCPTKMDPDAGKVDPEEGKTTFENPIDPVTKKEVKRPCPVPVSPKRECKPQTPNCEEPKPKCPKYLDEAKLKDYLSSCLSTTITMAKKGSAACLEKCEKVIGIRQPKCGEEKPSYYVLKKPKSEASIEKSNFENIFESETVKNIKNTVQDLMGTMYTKTKDTVNLIKSESCRHLGLEKDSKTKVCENKSINKLASVLSDKFKGQSSTEEKVSVTSSIEKAVEPALAVIEKVSSAISSTASVIKKTVDGVCDTDIDRSSPYDTPNINRNPPPPKEISHEHEPPENPSMFTMLKTKIFSMFTDNKQDCQDNEGEDDEEEMAEKLFDKYCDQS